MKQNKQIIRINEFIEQLSDKSNEDGVILLENEMEFIGASDPLGGKQNGGDCKNNLPGSCGSNGGNCINYDYACINSINSKACENVTTVGNCRQVCG